MKSVVVGFLLSLASVSAYIAGVSTLYPGYVINYNTPKNTFDSHFAYTPITGIDNTTLVDGVIGLAITTSLKPQELLYISYRTTPDGSGTPIAQNDGDKYTMANQTNGLFWVGGKANCNNGDVPTCKDSVEAEVSLWTTLHNNGTYHWPPYMMIDQRRTAKFSIHYGQWVYFWLTVTQDQMDANGVFNLYMGCQFYTEGSSSSVQMSVYKPTDPWPTAVNMTNATIGIAIDYYPLDQYQKNDWIQPSPTPLRAGIYKVAAQDTQPNQDAQFTIKVGFNKPPVQAATLNASFNLFGLVALIFVCIAANLKH